MSVIVRNVSKRYERGHETVHALVDVTFELAPATMTALVGPSGCGKSTLLNLIGCVDLPTTGEVSIDGIATQSLSDVELTLLRRDKVGIVFQSFHLIAALTLAENVAIPLLLARCKPEEIRARVTAALDRMEIADLADALPSQASGGQQQRAAIARAMIHRPSILLADEPTGSLDSRNGEMVMRILRELADEGQTILLATHSSEAAALCDRTIAMRDGRMVASPIPA